MRTFFSFVLFSRRPFTVFEDIFHLKASLKMFSHKKYSSNVIFQCKITTTCKLTTPNSINYSRIGSFSGMPDLVQTIHVWFVSSRAAHQRHKANFIYLPFCLGLFDRVYALSFHQIVIGSTLSDSPDQTSPLMCIVTAQVIRFWQCVGYTWRTYYGMSIVKLAHCQAGINKLSISSRWPVGC